jgi:hypothetical protein
LVGSATGQCFARAGIWDQGRERPGRETLADGLHLAPGDNRAAGASTQVQLRAALAVPVAEGVLLVAIVAIDRGRIDRRSRAGRALALGLMAVLVASAAVAASRLVVDLVKGGPETNSPTDLLKTGFLVWFYTIIAFTFLYWLLDGGGPESRFLAPREFPELAFPAQLNPGVAPPGWHPEFFDYLYLGFTDATAFSPTDVMPLARWAKLAMTVQAVSSLMILGLVIARAVNILR